MTDLLFGLFNDIVPTTTARIDIVKGAFRLDASYYSTRSRDAASAIATSGLHIASLRTLAEVSCSSVRERTFVDPGQGYPLLTGGDLDTTSDDDLRYVSRVYTRHYEEERLLKGDILLSSAGTVGKCDLVWDNHEGRLASQDIIRVRAKEGTASSGYLFAFLSGPIGNNLLRSQSAGSVIVRLYSERVDQLEIPRLAADAESIIAEKVYSSFEARAESHRLLKSAANLAVTLSELPGLPQVSNSDPDSVWVTDSEITAPDNEFRLQGNSYNPVVRIALDNLRSCGRLLSRVNDVAQEIRMSPLFVRNYVEKEKGVRYIAGKQLSQVRPDFKYISRTETEDLDIHLLHVGWTLVTCAGSVGKIGFVSPVLDGAAAQDVMRVVPDHQKIDGGYLNAWLRSEYGQAQLNGYVYGSVIDRISPEHVGKVLIPQLSSEDQKVVGSEVRAAYELKEKALGLETDAQDMLLRAINGSVSQGHSA
ncbi:MAG: hypothetical protein M3P26_07905 [Gemmatimonadota bacterium]|nr:hypothetical protein [Gemmatimonadota bacterium]